MRQIRMLVTGVGRRVELMQAFREAALALGVDLKIFGADSSGTAPALAWCDAARRVRGMREEGYVDELLEVCRADSVDLVLPTIDTDLMALALNRGRFAEIGARAVVSAPEAVALCRDKRLTAGLFESCGLAAPRTVGDAAGYEGPFPCFIKPRDGSSSVNAFKVRDASELAAYARVVGDCVVQPFVEGTEYTVDVFCGFDGEPIYITPRERVAVRAGEVLKTRISLDRRIIGEVERLVGAFRPCGPMTVQLIRRACDGEDVYIEVNPRFGGGAPLSMRAGARSAEALLRLALGERVGRAEPPCDGAVYSRFDQCVCTDPGDDRRPLLGVVFDLDDTLYPEAAYAEGGFRAVGRLLGEPGLAGELAESMRAGSPAPLDEALGRRGLLARKGECLAAYRSHEPEIAPYAGARELLGSLRAAGVRVGIVTDGRPEGQRAKLAALGLEGLVDDVVVTDELGGPRFRKPCDIAFRVLQRRWGVPFERMAYVGDNSAKDFQAPLQLGMRALWFDNPEGLHRGDGEPPAQAARVSGFAELADAVMRACGLVGGGEG